MQRTIAFALLAGLSGTACFPTFEDEPTLVTQARVLAVRGQPAEAKPGEVAEFTSLVATPSGPPSEPGLRYAFCLTPRDLAERNSVSSACLDEDDVEGEHDLLPINGRSASLPADACARFGPEPPPAEPGQPPLRPADPDPTGGFFQPVRTQLFANATQEAEDVAFGLERVRCSLAGAPAEIVRAFEVDYHLNANPEIAAVEVVDSSGTARDASTVGAIAPGATITLRVRWDGAQAESYPVYRITEVRLDPRTESMTTSWFSTAGTFEAGRLGRTEEEAAAGMAEIENRWSAPSTAGTVWMWIVLRDSRGGVGWRELRFEVGS